MTNFRVKLRVKEYRYHNFGVGSDYATVLELLTIGVAFNTSKNEEYISSHEGDHIGTVSRKIVDDIIHLMRCKFGINPTYLEKCKGDNIMSRPRTFGHGSIPMPENWRERCDFYWRNPVTIAL